MTLKGAMVDLQNLIDSDGIPFWAKPSLQKIKETVEEELRKEEKTERDNKDTNSQNNVIVVQIDCLMPMPKIMAFRKELLAQMKEGIIVIPPWAHVSHVGDECKVEIKEMKGEEE